MHTPSFSIQLLSLLGAALCLIPYVATQLHYMDAKKLTYSLLNAFGSAILTYVAVMQFLAGYFIMESVWLVASLHGCYQALQYTSLKLFPNADGNS